MVYKLNFIVFTCLPMFTDRTSGKGIAIGCVRPSVRPFVSTYPMNELTFEF